MQNLFVRSISGLVYGCIVIGCSFSSHLGHAFLASFLGMASILEWLQFPERKGHTQAATLMIGIFLLSLYLFSGAFDVEKFQSSMLSLVLLVMCFALVASQVFIRKQSIPSDLFHCIFGLIYIGLPLFLLPQISMIGGSFRPWTLFSIFVLLWISDTFAFAVGSLFGRHSFFERISPNKTWEGFVGSIIFTSATAVILGLYLPVFPIKIWVGLGLIVIVFSTVGDLFESALKRAYDLKDSGKFMPGHGGILDRIDSLLFVLPVAYFYLLVAKNHWV